MILVGEYSLCHMVSSPFFVLSFTYLHIGFNLEVVINKQRMYMKMIWRYQLCSEQNMNCALL